MRVDGQNGHHGVRVAINGGQMHRVVSLHVPAGGIKRGYWVLSLLSVQSGIFDPELWPEVPGPNSDERPWAFSISITTLLLWLICRDTDLSGFQTCAKENTVLKQNFENCAAILRYSWGGDVTMTRTTRR